MELTHNLSLCFGCCFVAAVSTSLYGEERSRSQTVAVEATPYVAKVHLGTLPINRPLDCRIRIQNQTAKEWRVREIKTDCGCISAKSDRKIAAPSETLEVHIQLAGSNKIAKVRRTIRVVMTDDSVIVLNLDVKVMGPFRLERNAFDFEPGQRKVAIEGKKANAKVHIDGVYSARGGFLLSDGVIQDADRFHVSIQPLSDFGAFSDIMRIRYTDGADQIQTVELPIELRSRSQLRFLPSTVLMQRVDNRWVGSTRMIVAPRETPIKTDELQFTASADDPESDAKMRIQTKLSQLSPILSRVQIAVCDDGQPTLPQSVEIEDRNGSLLGKLHLSFQGQKNESN